MSSVSVTKERAVQVLCGLVLVGATIASYAGTSLLQTQQALLACIDSPDEATEEAPDENPFAAHHGTHLIAFVITASDCGWSTLPQGKKAISALRSELRGAFAGSYAQVSVVAVDIDQDLDAGLRFLAELGGGTPSGAFDQVIVGGAWLNEQIVRFVWREGVARGASPQVLVIERPVKTDSYSIDYTLSVQDDRVVANPIGQGEILEWIEKGMPLDMPKTVA